VGHSTDAVRRVNILARMWRFRQISRCFRPSRREEVGKHPDGRTVKVLNFGLAKAMESQGAMSQRRPTFTEDA
jgi:hypothetical protein